MKLLFFSSLAVVQNSSMVYSDLDHPDVLDNKLINIKNLLTSIVHVYDT